MVKLRRDLVEQIYEILRERIVNLKMKPGSRINIQELASEFEVSPTPVKGALKKLSQRGLVTGKRRAAGYYVVNPSSEKIREIYELRKLFESFALESAIKNISTEKLKKFKKKMEKLEKQTDEEKKHIESYRIDQKLHLEIIMNCDNQALKDFYSQIYDLIKISQHFYRTTEEIMEEHIVIIEAMLKKDLAKAKKTLETHIDRAKMRTIEAIEKKISFWEGASLKIPDQKFNKIDGRG